VGDTKPSGRSSLVAMVQAANFRERDNPTDVRAMDRPWLRRVLGQCEMWPRSQVVRDAVGEDALEPGDTEYDHGIEALTSDRANDALDVGVGASCRLHRLRAVRRKPFVSPIPSIRGVAGRSN
jgi:hypothetical protein